MFRYPYFLYILCFVWVLRVFRYQSRRKEVYLKDADGALITAKMPSVQRCTLYALDGRRLVYVANEVKPGRGAQFEHFFLNGYWDDSACSGDILQDCRTVIVKKWSRRCLLFTVQSRVVASVISGKSTTEYLIWSNTHLLKSVYLVSARSVLHLSVLMEVWISEHSTCSPFAIFVLHVNMLIFAN